MAKMNQGKAPAKPAKPFSGYSSISSATKTAPSRSNAGGAVKGQARAAQVHAMNAAKKAMPGPVIDGHKSDFGRTGNAGHEGTMPEPQRLPPVSFETKLGAMTTKVSR
jgi:hypothetical protein